MSTKHSPTGKDHTINPKTMMTMTIYTMEQLEPQNPRWPHKLGEMHHKLGSSGEAIAAYVQAGSAYARQGFLLKAIAMCRLILGLDAEHAQAQQLLAQLSASRRAGGSKAEPDPSPVGGCSSGVRA